MVAWYANALNTFKWYCSLQNTVHPFKEGGLGIRDIKIGNEAASMRHVWSIVSRRESVWVKWVYKHLIKQRNFWTMNTPREAYWCWRRIMECRVKASKLAIHSIGNGDTTLFWKDPWHPLGILLDRFPQELLYDSTLHKDAKVSVVLQNNSWNVPPSVECSITEIGSYLDEVEIDAHTQDEVLWTAGNDGQFHLKSTYEALRKRKSSAEWSPLVWFKGNIPRHSFITWLLVHKALKTLSKLKQWGVVQQDLCPLCNRESETDTHLSFECHYSKYVWTKMLHYLSYSRQVSGWKDEIAWCGQHFTGGNLSSQIKKVTFNATVYFIWTERNKRIHEQQQCKGSELVKRIYNDVRLKFSVTDLTVEDNATSRQLLGRWNLDATFVIQRPVMCRWEKPPSGWHKLNTDGSLRGDRGGYGAVLRDQDGEVSATCTESDSGQTVVKHELQGVEASLKLARLHSFRRLVISTDSTNVLQYLTKPRNTAWNLRQTVQRIMRLLDSLEDYRIKHAYRETNRVADKLASLSPSTEFMEILPSSFAQDLKDIVHDDKLGKSYARL